jgi:uncharacterized protein YyaL (SSP411 family)
MPEAHDHDSDQYTANATPTPTKFPHEPTAETLNHHFVNIKVDREKRSKSFTDEATPAGNGIAAYVLQRMGHLLGESRYLDAAEQTLRAADITPAQQ